MKPTGFQIISGLGLLATLQGCEVGPNFHVPAAPDARLAVPAGNTAQQFTPGADIAGDWWTLYKSPVLNALIANAVANNPNLTAAQASLVEAQENLRGAYGVLSPTITGALGAQREQPSSAQLATFGGGSGRIRPYTLYNASLSVSYAVDLWGASRRNIEGLRAQAAYQRDELEAAYLSLTGNIVTAAVQLASLQAQIDATSQVIGAERQMLDILQAQQALGGASGAQVLQQQAQLAQAETTLPPLEAQLAQEQNQLAAYEGTFPGNAPPPVLTLAGLTLPRDVPVSLPSAIVAQRPDIRAASAQLHVASANVGIADAQMLPQITLSGEIGHSSLSPDTLFTPQTLLWNLVSGLSQPIFEGGQLAANRRGKIAALRLAGANYQNTVVTGFQNVADALAALQYDGETLADAQAARDAAAQSLAVTQAQYKLGGESLVTVLTAQTALQNAAITEVKAQAARLSDTAALYVALGGGWWHRADVARDCCGVVP
ncbi:efflux transporter outer membrane subunit [Acidocella sp.]|uniref:efflux transporter outer membrane subunit n=1 Tax=Acidocella sp. TaxID=50710 RepID=UPI00261AC79B|nr:efflux transporter outer membrane subunit [Acidocella sp.]